jgi:ATP-binding cassette, subfamily C, bacterial CydC
MRLLRWGLFRAQLANIRLGLPRDGLFKLGLGVAVLQGASAVALLGVSAWLISRAAEVNSIVYLGLAIVGVRGFAVGRATFRYLERILLHDSAFRMLAKRRPVLFERLVPFFPGGVSQLGRGETLARVVNDVDELQNLPLRVIGPLLQALLVAITSILCVYLLLPSAGVMLLIAVSLGFLVAIPLTARSTKSSDALISPLKAQLSNLSLNLIENQDVYLAYGWMPQKMRELEKVDLRLRAAVSKGETSTGAGLALLSLLTTLAMVSGAWFGGLAVEQAKLPGVWLAVLVLLPLAVFELLQNAQPSISAYRRFSSSANRVREILDREVPDLLMIKSGPEVLRKFESIDLLGIGVKYPETSQEVVSGVDLRLVPGEKLLVSGVSGSGKSSIALLLARLINPSSGQYLINGKSVDEFEIESVRRVIGLVEQNPTIFIGDVRANLLIAKPNANDSELISMLSRVGLWEMFKEREGLDTQLGDRGVLISGGEAQRLALARGLLAEFQVLILDEPTANVDVAQADRLMDDVFKALEDFPSRTLMLISHDDKYRKLTDTELRLKP